MCLKGESLGSRVVTSSWERGNGIPLPSDTGDPGARFPLLGHLKPWGEGELSSSVVQVFAYTVGTLGSSLSTQ